MVLGPTWAGIISDGESVRKGSWPTEAGHGDSSWNRLAPCNYPMVRIVSRMQERELLRRVALIDSYTRLPSVAERGAAPVQFGKMGVAGDAGNSPESLRLRDGIEPGLEPRRRGPARLVPRASAPVKRVRRRDGYARPMPRIDAPAALLGLAPELVELARIRADDLLTVCRTLAEILESLDALAQALNGLPVSQVEPTAVVADRPARNGQARAGNGRGQSGQAAGIKTPARRRELPDGLTEREVEVLLLVAEGRISKEIAAELCVAVPTVSRHLANIYGKISARGRADATRYALEHLPNELAARQEGKLN
jgi:DNA-binding CsgD family transcriptional regulator